MAQVTLQVGVQLGNLPQKSGFVVAQRVVDFVEHRELGVAQQAGLPQLRDPGAQLLLVGGQRLGGQGVFAVACGQRECFDVVTRREQLGNAALGVQNALALHLGRVGRQHRRHKTVGQQFGDGARRNTGPAQPCQCHVQAAFLGVACALMHRAPADVVAVFGQVGQVAEVGEGADHADRLVTREGLEHFFQRLVGFLVGIPPKSHGQQPRLFHQLIGGHTVLFPDHVAQKAAQQSDVVQQGAFVVARVFAVAGAGGGSGFDSFGAGH